MASRTRIALLGAAAALVAALLVVLLATGPPSPGGRAGSSGRNSGSGSGAGAAAGSESGPRSGSGSGSGFDGAALPPGVKAYPFELTALAAPADGGPEGGEVSLGQFEGKVLVMAFLFPGCGPACTLIADQIRGALNELGQAPAVVIVQASKTSGTRARVRARGRGRRFLEATGLAGKAYYLTGTPRQLQATWRAYGVVPASAGRAKFDEYAQVLLIDDKGYERVLFGSEDLTAEGLAHDIAKLQAG